MTKHSTSGNIVILDGEHLAIETLVGIARSAPGSPEVKLSPAVFESLKKVRRLIQEAVSQQKVVYGVTTGFGALATVVLSKEQTKDLQRNILLSHSAGVGEPFDLETTRAIMALRAHGLAKGYSGIRPETLQVLVGMINKGVCPIIPQRGSVGASGDLAPLAHMALVLIGEGEAFYQGERLSGGEAMRRAGLPTVQLEEAEGLALVNGTQVMTAIGALVVHDATLLMKAADIAAGISLEVLMGSNVQLNPKIHTVRPHPGQSLTAENLRRLTADSAIITSHKDCTRVQDAYSIRCIPQVHGASRDALEYVRRVITTEMNSATDNPLFFADTGEILTGGNFHGQPVALAMDFLSMALSELANISERRVERLVNPYLSGLPAFLIKDPGLNSGLMLAQYTAAALVSENKSLCHPASVDSIPTSANKEDHVSMGPISARKCREVLRNAQYVTAIELLCAAQAMDLFTNLKPGRGTLEAYNLIRQHVPHMEVDRVISRDIETLYSLVQKGTPVECVEKKLGKLN
ncbi:MAG TPA: histidine ammonia-lyase [Candidatus Hypogeohydataceae bacterium YC41]